MCANSHTASLAGHKGNEAEVVSEDVNWGHIFHCLPFLESIYMY